MLPVARLRHVVTATVLAGALAGSLAACGQAKAQDVALGWLRDFNAGDLAGACEVTERNDDFGQDQAECVQTLTNLAGYWGVEDDSTWVVDEVDEGTSPDEDVQVYITLEDGSSFEVDLAQVDGEWLVTYID